MLSERQGLLAMFIVRSFVSAGSIIPVLFRSFQVMVRRGLRPCSEM
jgi:hypothetical protein